MNLAGGARLPAASEGFGIANEGGALVTAGAINTKGTPAVVQATTPFDADMIIVQLTSKSSAADQLIDLMIGGAGSEVVVVPNIYYTAGSNSAYGKTFMFPVAIPAGSRLSARSQSATASVTARVAVYLIQTGTLGMQSFSKIVAYGASTAASRGTGITDPGAAGAWGAWTQVVAATSEPLKWILPIFGDRSVATRTSGAKYVAQIGRGANPNEQGVGPEHAWNSSSTSFSISSFQGVPCDIASGERLSVRWGGSSVVAASLGVDVVIYGGVG